MEVRKLVLKLFLWWQLSILLFSDNILISCALAKRNSFWKLSKQKFISCQLPAIKNGKTKVRNGGRKIRYKCFKPSKLVGSPIASCINGQWFPIQTPVCVTVGCGQIEGIQRGNKIVNGYTEDVIKNAFVKFHCHPGHQMAGNESVYCDGFHWSGSAPTCAKTRVVPNLVIDFDDCLKSDNSR